MYTSRLEPAEETTIVTKNDYTVGMIVFGEDKLPGMSGVIKSDAKEISTGIYEYRVMWYFMPSEKIHKTARKDRSTQKSTIQNVLTRDLVETW